MAGFTAITLLSLQGPTKVCMYVYIDINAARLVSKGQVFAP